MDEIEEADYVATEHDRLVSAISKLDKTQYITEATRSEPTNQNSEFNLIKKSNKLNLNKVADILESTSHHVQISKKLKKTHHESKVLSKPLEKPQADRIKRASGYEETKQKVGRWDPVVARNRTVDYVSFPLKHVSTKLQPTGEFLSKLKLKSDLEKELEEIDPPAVEEIEDEEEDKVFPMSYDEMIQHRDNVAKLRARQSYKAAKAKRQSKIKSKKYHRVLKKEKLKQQLKEFEDLQRKDPEEALKKLEAIEKDRALERHTLRHKNTGKWAKNKLIRAKYDKEVRQQLAEQLAVSKSLTQKVNYSKTSDTESDNELIPDLNLHISQDPEHPWMFQSSEKSNVNSEYDFGYKKFLQTKKNIKLDSDSDSSDENMSVEINDKPNDVLKHIPKQKQAEKSECKDHSNELSEKQKHIPRKSLKKVMTKIIKPIATSDWTVELVNKTIRTEEISTAFENHQTNIENMVEQKLKEIRWNIEKLEQKSRLENNKNQEKPKESKEKDNLEYLKFKPKNVKAIIDEKLIETSSKTIEDKVDSRDLTKLSSGVQVPVDSESNVDLNTFNKVKPKFLNTSVTQLENEYDQLDDDDQVVPKLNMEEALEDDDAEASFRQEKEDEIHKDKVEDINLSMPGWGTWGGKGVKPQKRKRNRFILKAPPKTPRRDENKGDIIIREYKDPKLSVHKIKDVPFPFESVKDYEASIRAPLGNTFIPEKAHKKLIRPNVITKAGTIIDPMDEEELLVPKNRNYKNKSVLKLLGQK